jgi:uncharacterized delta-60 repeat protein
MTDPSPVPAGFRPGGVPRHANGIPARTRALPGRHFWTLLSSGRGIDVSATAQLRRRTALTRKVHAPRSQRTGIAVTLRTRFLLPGIAASALFAAGGVLAATSASAAPAPGSVDTSFGTNGTATTDVTTILGADTNVNSAVVQPNGDIVFSHPGGLIRELPTGKLDPSFGSGGSAAAAGVQSIGASSTTVALQPDGKIIWAGAGAAPNGAMEWEIARFNANGTLDTSFGQGGVVKAQFFTSPTTQDDEQPTGVLVQPNGGILVSGFASQGGGPHGAAVLSGNALVRYNPNGTLDTSFGTGGEVLTGDFGPGVTVISSNLAFTSGELGLDASGDIFVVPGSNNAGAEAELSSSGQLDPAVSAATITAASAPAVLANGQYEQANAVAIAKHVEGIKVGLFNAGGALESASSPLKLAGIPGGRLPGGQTLVGAFSGGTSLVDGAGPELVALNPADGSADTAFGDDGVATSSLPGNEAVEEVVQVITESNGQILVATETTDNGSNGDQQISLTLFNG